MKVIIKEDSVSKFPLEKIQMLGGDTTMIEKADIFFTHFAKQNPILFPDANKLAALQTWLLRIGVEEKPKPSNVGEYKLPNRLLNVRVGHFKEMVNVEIDEFLIGAEVIAGCMYRKDWDRDFSEEEIIETALYFRKQPLLHTLWAIHSFEELVKLLKENYPILYDDHPAMPNKESEDDGRRMYDLIIGLAKDQATEIEAAENLKLSTAFPYMESKKIAELKKALNSQ